MELILNLPVTTQRLTHNSNTRPLVLILSWLMAKQQHVLKYAEVYVEKEFDVVIVVSKPWDVLWPTTGSQKIAYNIVNLLAANSHNYSKMIIHGFSGGGYLWGECLRHYKKDPARYNNVMGRIVAQIWDSIVESTESHIGVSKAVFPENDFMQKSLQSCIQLYQSVFYDTTMCHLVKSSAALHAAEEVKAPALFFFSKADQIGTENASRNLADDWMKAGVDVTLKCFDSSPHVGHFVKYRDEYLKYLLEHFINLKLI